MKISNIKNFDDINSESSQILIDESFSRLKLTFSKT